MAVLPDGKRALSASYDQTLKLWDLDSGKQLATFTGDADMVSITLDPRGQIIIAGDHFGRVGILELVDEESDIRVTPRLA